MMCSLGVIGYGMLLAFGQVIAIKANNTLAKQGQFFVRDQGVFPDEIIDHVVPFGGLVALIINI